MFAADSAELSRTGTRVTLAVDSDETIAAASRAGVPEVLIDVNVGPSPVRLPAVGCGLAGGRRPASQVWWCEG